MQCAYAPVAAGSVAQYLDLLTPSYTQNDYLELSKMAVIEDLANERAMAMVDELRWRQVMMDLE